MAEDLRRLRRQLGRVFEIPTTDGWVCSELARGDSMDRMNLRGFSNHEMESCGHNCPVEVAQPECRSSLRPQTELPYASTRGCDLESLAGGTASVRTKRGFRANEPTTK